MTFSHLIIAVFVGKYNKHWDDHRGPGWASVAFGLITPPLVQNTGFGAYTFFAVFCLLSFVWTYFFVPETRGRTLEQMDHVFKDIDSEEEEARRRAIEAEIIASHHHTLGLEGKEGLSVQP
ncbi:MAG: hypothetical protein Q9218_005564 [Villophora microphyllina]